MTIKFIRANIMNVFENIKECVSYFEPIRKIKQFWWQFKRSSKWFVRMWNNPDYDFDYFIEMIVLKMKDMRYQLDVIDADFVDLRHQPKGVCCSDSEDTIDNLQSLDKAIEIGERIMKNDYNKYTPRLNKWFDKYGFNIDIMPDDLRKELLKIYKEADENEKNDRDEFFNIIRDNHIYWWS